MLYHMCKLEIKSYVTLRLPKAQAWPLQGGAMQCRNDLFKIFQWIARFKMMWYNVPQFCSVISNASLILLWPYKTILNLCWSGSINDLDSYGICFTVTSCPKYSGVIPLIIIYISHIMLHSLFTYNRARPHISPVLCDLHWLPIDQRIEYKDVLVLASKLCMVWPLTTSMSCFSQSAIQPDERTTLY